MRPTHRQIETFRALMLAGSMTEAARMLSVTQPAVSKIISQLEEELGFALFERHKGKLSPTADGYILYAEVEESYSGLERVTRAARRIKARGGGNLRLAVMPALATGFLARILRRLSERNADLQISVQSFGSEEIVDLVASGLCDLGYAMTPVDTTRIHPGPVLSIPSFCILPPGHALACRREISVFDLENEDFIATAEGSPSRLRTDSLFTSMNVSRHIRLEARWSLTITELVQAGLGCSIVEGFSAATFAAHGGIVRPLKERLDFSFVSVAPQASAKPGILRQFNEAFDTEFEIFRQELLAGDLIAAPT